MKTCKLYYVLISFLFILLFTAQAQACDTSPVITYPSITDLGDGTYQVAINLCVGNGGSESGWTTEFEDLNIISFSPAALINGANTATGSITNGVLDYSYPGNGANMDVFVEQNANTCFDYTLIVDGIPTPGVPIIYVGVNCENTNCSGSCSVFNGNTQLSIIMPSSPTCGEMFYDAGGPNYPYPSVINYTTTICPIVSGDIVTVDFTLFELTPGTSSGYYYYGDVLRVFNGPDSFSSIIGSFTALNPPGTVLANGPTGCLTFQFSSESTNFGAAGWEALVICENPTSISTIPSDKIFPNPADDLITIQREKNTNISIRLVDLFGRELWYQKTSESIIPLRIDQLTAGVYLIIMEENGQTFFRRFIKE